ncbi:phage tail tape measure protein [Timonella senegalensis]|uniref:phage tail tape measure protein n=1 Tax=Timonella senegalensis TaxID=1465825 RepID=UPI002FDCD2A6
MANRTVKVVLEANVSGLTNGFRTAQKSVQDFNKQFSDAVKNKPQELATVTQSVGIVGGALTAMAAVSTKKAADFEQAMSNVRAATHASAQDMDVLSKAALEAGASTMFSASEAAGAIEELSKAGLTTGDIISGGLYGALDLAAAGGLEVAQAAEITSASLNQFGLKGDQAAHVADLLAAGAGKANGEVSDLGMALNQAGLIANQTGLSIEETTGGLAAFAQAGLMGSDAGTSMKTMLQRLTPQSKAAEKQFEALGISAYDAQGNFVGLADFAGQLETAMKGLSPEARNAAMGVMFGADAVRAATVLYDEGADGIQTWIDAVNDQGYAAETAGLRLDNLMGDVEALGGALDTAFIKSGAGVNQALRGIVQGATDAVDAFGKLPDGVQSGLGILTGSTGVAALAVAGMAGVATKVSEARSAFQALGVSAKTAGVALGAAGAAIGVATVALGHWATEAAKTNALTDEIYNTLDKVTGATTKQTRETIAAELATRKYNEILGMGGSTATTFAKRVGVTEKALTDAAMGSKTAIAELERLKAAQKKADPGYDHVSWEFLWKAIRNGNKAMEESGQRFEDIEAATDGASSSTDSAALAVDGLTAAYESNAEAVQEAYDATMAYINGALSSERAAMNYEAAIDAVTESVEKNGNSLDIGTEKGRANRATLLEIADAGMAVLESARERGASEEELQGIMETTRQDLIKAYGQYSDNKDAAKAYADSLGLIPSKVNTDITLTANTGAAESIVNGFIARQQQKVIQLQIVAKGYTPAHSAIPVMRASGGSVFGAGTETSDSIPAMLSNNEHVWTAAEVKGAGGHGQVERMRALAKAGVLPAFAKGGKVTAELKASQNELRLDIRRGLIMDDVRGGGYAAADRLWAASKDKELSSTKRGSLAKQAREAEKALKSLYKQVDKAEKKWESAKERLGELKAARTQIANSLKDGFELGGQTGSGHYMSVAGQVGSAKSYSSKLTKLHGSIKTLASWGMPSSLLQQIIGLPIDEAVAQASAWVKAGQSQTLAIIDVQKDIDRKSGKIGTLGVSNFTTSDGKFFKSLSAAESAVTSSKKSLTSLNKKVDSWGSKITKILGKAYGLKGYAAGGYTGDLARNAVAGVTHGQEFVVNADATSKNRQVLEAMNRGVPVSPRVAVQAAVIDYSKLAAALASQPLVVKAAMQFEGRQLAALHAAGVRESGKW